MNDEENLESVPLSEEKDAGIVPVDSFRGDEPLALSRWKIRSLADEKSIPPRLSAVFVLLCGCVNALSMTPGEEFVSAFGLDPSFLDTTNCVESITNVVDTTICTNSWTIQFSVSRFKESVETVSFVATYGTNETSIAGTVERHATPEDAFWSAATHICANSLPMYVHTRDWRTSTNATDILFSHRYPSSTFDDKRISISRNILLMGETSGGLSFELPFGVILHILQTESTETNECQ